MKPKNKHYTEGLWCMTSDMFLLKTIVENRVSQRTACRVTFYSFWVSLTHNKLHLLFIFFIRCTKSGIKQISCPSGLAFDVDKQTCDWKGKVNNCDRLESKSYNSWWRWRSIRKEIKWETEINLLLIHHSIIYLAIIFITRILIRISGTSRLDSAIYLKGIICAWVLLPCKMVAWE